MIISTPQDLPNFEKLFGDGSSLGLKFSYKEQPSPDGLSQAFILGEEFIGSSKCAMILGDNIFYGDGLVKHLKNAAHSNSGAVIFGYYVSDPERFGVVEFDKDGKVISLEEKPHSPKSNYAVTGLYFYDNNVCDYARSLRPSARGELEITDLNKIYLDKNNIEVITLGRGYAWLDTGTIDALTEASEYIRVIEKRLSLKIGAIEEIAYHKGWIDKQQLLAAAEKYGKSSYAQHLRQVGENKILY